MAEVLGAVSSALAVAEVAVKAGTAVAKLRSLWAEVRDVPDAIRDLMREMEILDPLVSEMEREFGGSGSATAGATGATSGTGPSPLLFNDASGRLGATHCRAALDDLRSLVNELSFAIDSWRRSRGVAARFKVVLKKETLARLHDRLHRAVRLLNAAQMSYLISLTKVQPDFIMALTENKKTSRPLPERGTRRTAPACVRRSLAADNGGISA